MLAPDTEAPEVTETTVRTDLLQPLEIVTELRVNGVGKDLAVLAINDIPLPVKEPGGDLELCGVLDDSDETFQLVRVEFTSTGIHTESTVRPLLQRTTHRLLRSTSAFLQTMLA